ncbi:MAG: hypothetical protein RLZZ282_902 [Verrucomicrobiota bacterium]
MHPLPTEFKKRCLEAALDLLWRQWCSLGAAGHAQPAEPTRIIDPEALLLATTQIGHHDPRLFDESLDWLSKNGSLIHLQRLKTLHADTGLGDPIVLAAMAEWLVKEGRQPKWKALANDKPDVVETRPLFGGKSPKAPDPVFLRHGLLRERVVLRGMSRTPNPTLAPNLLLALRALIGVGARAEVILCLATGPAVHAAELARLTGYKPRTLQLLLQEMALSGHVLTQEPPSRPPGSTGRGSSRRYHLQAGDWAFLTDGKPLPRWIPWTPLWRIVQEILDSLIQTGESPKHSALLSSRLRESLAAQGQELAAAGLLPLLDLRSTAPGTEILTTLAERLPTALDRL